LARAVILISMAPIAGSISTVRFRSSLDIELTLPSTGR
jgi:hypothetical protein